MDIKVSVPEGVLNEYSISKYSVKKDEDILSFMKYGRGVPEGTYTKLTRSNQIIMSDTPDEIRDHLSFIWKAEGRVLIAGLGIGMVLQEIAKNPKVSEVVCVEISKDVIDLVWDHYDRMFGNKIKIIHSSIFDVKLKGKFDYGWYDIWDNICTDNYDEMKKLHRKFGRKVKNQGSWSRNRLLYLIQKEKRESWRY